MRECDKPSDLQSNEATCPEVECDVKFDTFFQKSSGGVCVCGGGGI